MLHKTTTKGLLQALDQFEETMVYVPVILKWDLHAYLLKLSHGKGISWLLNDFMADWPLEMPIDDNGDYL